MPSYTLPLKTVHELGGGTWAAIGLDQYPIYDPTHRDELNDKIFQHYFNEEVAHETSSLFRQSMKSRMSLIMPYYNDLYRSTEMEYDPLLAVDMTTDGLSHSDGTGDVDRTSNSTQESTSTQDSVSDGTASGMNYAYPQQQINTNGQYATSGQDSKNHSDTNASSTDNGTASTTENTDSTTSQDSTSWSHQHGRATPGQDLIQAFRDAILNIDQLIVVELEDLFMGTWTTGQAFMGNMDYGYGYTPYYGYGY